MTDKLTLADLGRWEVFEAEDGYSGLRLATLTHSDLIEVLESEGGEPADWCDEHHSVWMNENDGCEAYASYQVDRRTVCRPVKVLVIPVEGL